MITDVRPWLANIIDVCQLVIVGTFGGNMWYDGEWHGAETEPGWPYLPSVLRTDNDDWKSIWTI